MSEENVSLKKIETDPFKLMIEGDKFRGSQILKLGDNQVIDIKILDIYGTELRPEDIVEKDRSWAEEELKKLQDQGWEHKYIPNLVMEVEALSGAIDNNGSPIQKGTKFLFNRTAKNTFWKSLRNLGYSTLAKSKGKQIRLMKLSGKRGQTIIIPETPAEN